MRTRTKERIERLEAELESAKCSRAQHQQVITQELLRRNEILEEELRWLQSSRGLQLVESPSSTPTSTPDSVSPSWASLDQVRPGAGPTSWPENWLMQGENPVVGSDNVDYPHASLFPAEIEGSVTDARLRDHSLGYMPFGQRHAFEDWFGVDFTSIPSSTISTPPSVLGSEEGYFPVASLDATLRTYTAPSSTSTDVCYYTSTEMIGQVHACTLPCCMPPE